MSATMLTMDPHAVRTTAARAMSGGRLLRAYLTEARFEALRMLRAPAFALPFLVLPVVIYLFFGVVVSGGDVAKNPKLADVLFLGFSTMAVMGPALFGMACTLAVERESGLMKLKRALPAPPGAYLLSKMIMSMFFAVVAMVLMVGVALVAGKVHMSAGQMVAAAAILVAGAVPFCAIGLFIGAHVSGGAAPAITNLVYLPMIWLSGLFIPLTGVMQKLVVIWPAFHLDQLAMHAIDLDGYKFMPPAMSAAMLLAVTLVFGGAAIRRLARVG